MNIKYIKNGDLDKERWDKVIEASPNGRVYAYSWYLDILTNNQWDALIANDYEYIMPLPWRQKYGIHYIYTPNFIQQLGIFSLRNDASEQLAVFLKSIPRKFMSLDLCVNSCMEVKQTRKIRPNFILDISRSYDGIYTGYKASARNKLRKGHAFCLTDSVDVKSIITDYIRDNGYLVPFVDEDYDRLEKAMEEALRRNCLDICKLSDENGNVQASGFFLKSHGRIYHFFSSQTAAGRKVAAKHFLIDNMIKRYAGKMNLYDFVGSGLPGVAEFIKKWGSAPEYYSNIRFAKFPVNLFKK